MTTLVALGARFFDAGGDAACRVDGQIVPLRTGVGVVMPCPCGGLSSCVGPLAVPFANPVDGGGFLDTAGLQRSGDTLETLSVTGVIQRIGGCGWHGSIEAGSVVTRE